MLYFEANSLRISGDPLLISSQIDAEKNIQKKNSKKISQFRWKFFFQKNFFKFFHILTRFWYVFVFELKQYRYRYRQVFGTGCTGTGTAILAGTGTGIPVGP